MDLKEYQKLCKRTAREFSTKEKEIMTWGLGIAGESGDVAGCIKKIISHHSPDHKEGLKENLGDTMWYIAMICNHFDWDLEEVLEENMEKLKKRYPNGFTFKEAQRGGTKIDWNEKEE